ncbi:MAG: 2-oxoglutarate dehydrogenase, E2 component, dihydrolipoamide succinyltransferase, partial [Geodermatophilaceae bacterium]|nr:2-oxoglutarate dehydrogenase, E2 component, dihydrolipoamide succinyltransferase [Geodermatophilaceae bacterium]
MPVSVTMPALGESVTEGTVTRWLKQEGEQVQADEPLLEVSTDKVDTEIPSPASGILTRIVVSEDETVDVGTELAVIGDAADAESDSGSGDEDGAEDAPGADGGEPGQSEDAADGDAGPSEDEGDADAGQSEDEADADTTDGDAADNAVQEAAGAEQADQPSEPAKASDGSHGSESGSDDGASASADSGDSKSGGGKSGGGTSITMPALGESVTEGTVTRWLKNVGDDVAIDEPLLEVSTDKVDTEIPSPVAGTLLEITVNEDETVEVGAQLATIGTASDDEQDAGDEQDADGDAEEPADEKAKAPAESQPQDDPSSTDSQQDEKPADEEPADGPGDAKPKDDKPSDAVPAAKTTQPAADAGGSAAYVTPLVRKLAAEHSVD